MYNLIIVDDEDNAREGLGNYIDWESMGFHLVDTFDCGEAVLDFLDETDEQIHVILSDIRMERMTGIQLAKAVANKYKNIKVIFLTAHRDFEYARQAVSLQVVEYLLKPAQIADIKRVFSGLKQTLDQEQTADNNNTESDNGSSFKTKVKEYIESHYNKEDCSLTDVSAYVGLVPSYFSRLFKSEFGIGFMDYLTEIRVNKAKELLDRTNMYVNEVSSNVGYDSPRYFTRIFKRQTGLLPGDYRRRERDNG